MSEKKTETNNKHEWKVIDVLLYETFYKCEKCGSVFKEASDNPYLKRPHNGCKNDNS